ncbi:MAG: transposase [Lachnospiraceae bacterium]|nr:transposase [Lachnospiraceae bacterium]
MQITSSYSVEIRKQDLCFRKTFEVYRSAAAYLIPVFDSVWGELEETGSAKRRFNAAEHLVHNTKKNTARFDFDLRFPKMPSYLRRAAIQFALGTVSSYRTRLEAWKKEAPFQGEGGRDASGKTAKGRPVLQAGNHAMPVFYHDVMYKAGEAGSDQAKLKLFDGHDWVWKEVRLKHTDMEYLRRHWCGKEASAPALEKRHRKYFLRFTYTEEADLPDRPAGEQTVCAVDLGINTDAVCSIMRSDGTVPARKFISFPGEKDHLKHVLGRIRRSQREHGADVIVFEYLEMKGKIRGSRKQRLHMWRKRDVQKRCTHLAHRKGMRVSRVCAWNTSALAFDGSGKVERSAENHSLCRFSTGKQYNCDLSASYNIGARYFIRELIKPLPETARSLLEAKVPAVKRRSSCVYADLLKLPGAMEVLSREPGAA